MLFAEDEVFTSFTFWDFVESGLYFVIVGYYFLLFAFFLLMRYRTSKKMYWLFFSLIFIFLAAGRVFFISYYFLIPESQASDDAILASLMINYRFATFCTWMAVACIMGVLGILLFPPEAQVGKDNKKEEKAPEGKLTPQMKLALRIIFIAVPVFVGFLALLILPDTLLMDPKLLDIYDNAEMKKSDLVVITFGDWSYPAGRFVLNFVLLPICVLIIPLIYLYLAIKTFGVLRKSYLLNCIGFILYFAGRIAQGLLVAIDAEHTAAVLPPLLILVSLLILVLANNYEQLR